jgi:hypothetical protein
MRPSPVHHNLPRPLFCQAEWQFDCRRRSPGLVKDKCGRLMAECKRGEWQGRNRAECQVRLAGGVPTNWSSPGGTGNFLGKASSGRRHDLAANDVLGYSSRLIAWHYLAVERNACQGGWPGLPTNKRKQGTTTPPAPPLSQLLHFLQTAWSVLQANGHQSLEKTVRLFFRNTLSSVCLCRLSLCGRCGRARMLQRADVPSPTSTDKS